MLEANVYFSLEYTNMVTVCQHPECKKLIAAKRSTKKFCSAACRQAAHRLAQKTRVTLKCAYCGEKMKYSGKGRVPKFCKDGHRVQYHRCLQAAILRAMTKGGRAFPVYQYTAYDAWAAMEEKGLQHWQMLIEAYDYKFNGHYFVDLRTQGVLL
jgi:hypothetical protein